MRKDFKSQASYLDYIFNKPYNEWREFLIRPVPKQIGTLMLTIVRNKSGLNRWHPKYTLVSYLVDDKKYTEWKELLVGKKRSKNKNPTYLVSLDIKNPKPHGNSYVGKVKLANKKKLNFVIFDHGCNPKKEKKFQWRKTLWEFSFKTIKIPKFGSTRIATIHFVPIEGKFLNGGKFEDYLKLETHEIIRLMNNVMTCQTKLPIYDKNKNKYVSF